MRPRKIAALVVTGVAAFAGCSHSDSSPNTAGDSSPLHMSDGTTLFRHSGDGGLDALATGELARVGTCVGMTFSDGMPMIMVWPQGTKEIDGDRDGIVVGSSDTEILFGETFSIGGGGAPGYETLIEECNAPEDAGVWIVAPN